MNRELRTHVINFLKPYMDEPSRRTWIEGALYGCEVTYQIGYWERDTDTFTNELVTKLTSYGRCQEDSEPALLILIRFIGEQRGIDVKEVANKLCDELARQPLDPSPTSQNISTSESSNTFVMQNHIYISFANSDIDVFERIKRHLNKLGYVVWIDLFTKRGLGKVEKEIVDGISNAIALIVIIPSKEPDSARILSEIEIGKHYNIPIYPILMQQLSNDLKQTYEELLTASQFLSFTHIARNDFKDLQDILPIAPDTGLKEHCQKLVSKLEDVHWGVNNYIQEEAKLLPIYVSPYDDGMQYGKSENLLQRLRNSRRTIVLGEPGMGKSVALERLAWELAQNSPPVVPVIINLREYDNTTLVEWIRLKLLETDVQRLRITLHEPKQIEYFLEYTPFKLYILLDGLNEVPMEYRDTILQDIRRLAMLYPQHAIVVTSRVQDESWRKIRQGSLSAETMIVQPISQTQAYKYLVAHLGKESADELWEQLDSRMRGLAQTPLLLWMIKETWAEIEKQPSENRKDSMPGNRGELYAKFINRMLNRDDAHQLSQKFSKSKRLQALEKLALTMHNAHATTLTIERVESIIDTEELIQSLLVNGLIIGDDVIRFGPHQTFQEHFAARATKKDIIQQLANPTPRQRNHTNNKIIQFPHGGVNQESPLTSSNIDIAYVDDSWWWETLIQLAGLVEPDVADKIILAIANRNPWLALWCAEEGQSVDENVRHVIEEKSISLVNSSDVSQRRSAVQVLITIEHERVLPYLRLLVGDRHKDIAMQAIDALMFFGPSHLEDLFLTPDSRWDNIEILWARYAIGSKWSKVGDPRKGIQYNDDIPDIDWVLIPDDGKWIYQEQEYSGIPAFFISKYPITYSQFLCFENTADGINDKRWWIEAPDTRYLNLAGEKHNNHPYNNVSWYEAMAFCRWLSWKLGGEYHLDAIDKWLVRLPTEYEWEKAARGTDGRQFPYGRQPSNTKMNTSELVQVASSGTNTVGVFVEGASPYGVQDMAGNVWEWTLSDFHNPMIDPTDENLNSGNRRVLRGGSFSDKRYYAATTFRSHYIPAGRFRNYGFRIVKPIH